MNLHRAGKQPEWETTSIEGRNVAQKVAATTRGTVTPGNACTLAGAVLVGLGYRDIARNKTSKGVVKVAFGRSFDVLDGLAAHLSRTKSPLGEAADVVVDKIELAGGLPLFVAKGIIPESFAAAAGLQAMASTYYTREARQATKEIHPGKKGKYSTALQWAAITAYGASKVAHEAGNADTVIITERIGHALAAASVVLGALSVWEYRQDALAPAPVCQVVALE